MLEINLLEGKTNVTLNEYLDTYKKRIIPDSERLFVKDFLYPLLGPNKISMAVPQYPFIDSEGHHRQIDFAIVGEEYKLAFEIDGETYHGEGIIPSEQFDDNLFRQNEILFHGWVLRRYSYTQLCSPTWRSRVMAEIKLTIKQNAPELLGQEKIIPNALQREVLPLLESKRALGWKKGLCIMPVGTGKTYTAAIDSYKYFTEHPRCKVLFIVHKIDILSQARISFGDVWHDATLGILTGIEKEHVHDSDILFASKDSLCSDDVLNSFQKDYFDYIIVDEVHHGEAPTYRKVLNYFKPKFLLGMTATPDRTDRKDILALFDYLKICEYDLNDAIDRGFLVAYEYHGLTDNIDYSHIRYNGRKYNEKDLEKALIINKRNQAIFEGYMKYCHGDKTIGFCVSIKHAEAMAAFFNERGVSAIAITSKKDAEATKAELIAAFKDNQYAIAFTVDIFNEGIDVPNVQALLFLRPTESKTVFVQQLGRGLRLSSNKSKVIVLDFISNYKHANLVRQYLAKKVSEKTKADTGAFEKNIYEYNPRCKVEFDDQVQQILDLQDQENHEVNEDDLVDAYYAVKTQLLKKPSPDDINHYGKYKIGKYISVFGSWIKFLRSINEITENGYHYPQGLHMGHILYILQTLMNENVAGTNLDDKYVRLRGDLDKDADIAAFQRQTKYKVQGMMGMGLLEDDRKLVDPAESIKITKRGENLYHLLMPIIHEGSFQFKDRNKGISWEMAVQPDVFIADIKSYLDRNPKLRIQYIRIMLKVDFVTQALSYLYHDCRAAKIEKATFYQNLFETEKVKRYCDINGIEIPSEEARKHRAPFIVSILESMGIVETTRSEVEVKELLFVPELLADSKIDHNIVDKIGLAINNYSTAGLPDAAIESAKEFFGADIFTPNYYLSKKEILEEK